jgi:hypothetical protein
MPPSEVSSETLERESSTLNNVQNVPLTGAGLSCTLRGVVVHRPRQGTDESSGPRSWRQVTFQRG